MSQAQDLAAIDHFFRTVNARTPAALALQMQWPKFYDNLSWFQKNTDDDTLAKASRYRDDFNAANTPPASTPKPNNPTAGAPVPAPLKLTIKQGSSGPNVVEWQRILGINPADGKFGPQTRAQTVSWQQKHGLTADGIVGPATWAKAVEAGVYKAVADSPASMPPSTSGAKPSLIRGTLKQGSSGADVASWQKTIGATPDGKFGPETERLTKEWQKAHGLPTDGVVTTATKAVAVVMAAKPKQTTTARAADAIAQAVKTAPQKTVAAVKAAPQAISEHAKNLPLWSRIVIGFVTAGGAVIGLTSLLHKPKGRAA